MSFLGCEKSIFCLKTRDANLRHAFFLLDSLYLNNLHCYCSWKKVSRSQCSAHCGKGVRQVNYQCARIDLPSEDSKQSLLEDEADLEDMPWAIPVDDLHCSNIPRPSDVEPCEGPCDATRWDYSLWSEVR